MGPENVSQLRLVAQVSPERLDEFKQRMQTVLDEFSTEPVDEDAERTAVYVALYPSR